MGGVRPQERAPDGVRALTNHPQQCCAHRLSRKLAISMRHPVLTLSLRARRRLFFASISLFVNGAFRRPAFAPPPPPPASTGEGQGLVSLVGKPLRLSELKCLTRLSSEPKVGYLSPIESTPFLALIRKLITAFSDTFTPRSGKEEGRRDGSKEQGGKNVGDVCEWFLAWGLVRIRHLASDGNVKSEQNSNMQV